VLGSIAGRSDEKGRVSLRQCDTSDTVPVRMSKLSGPRTRGKNKNNLECGRSHVSEIKLKRTDTTLDLSQKAKRAEKGKGNYVNY